MASKAHFPEVPVVLAPEPAAAVSPVVPVPAPAVVPPPVMRSPEALVTPTVIMTEADAYIHERVASQPTSLDEVRRAVVYTDTEQNRLSLPDYFERFSHDCTRGQGCQVHSWHDEGGRWSYGNRGEFIFRWIKKAKRAIDHAMNVQGWFFVNRRYFPEAPHHLFSANGGIELGDLILFFLPAKQALLLRAAPGKRSTEMVRSRMTRIKDGKVLMTGEPENDRFYTPTSSDAAEEEDVNETTPGIQEDRDF